MIHDKRQIPWTCSPMYWFLCGAASHAIWTRPLQIQDSINSWWWAKSENVSTNLIKATILGKVISKLERKQWIKWIQIFAWKYITSILSFYIFILIHKWLILKSIQSILLINSLAFLAQSKQEVDTRINSRIDSNLMKTDHRRTFNKHELNCNSYLII